MKEPMGASPDRNRHVDRKAYVTDSSLTYVPHRYIQSVLCDGQIRTGVDGIYRGRCMERIEFYGWDTTSYTTVYDEDRMFLAECGRLPYMKWVKAD